MKIVCLAICIPWPDENPVKFMNISTEHILQCNQTEPPADASERIVDLMNENDSDAFLMFLKT